MKADAVDGGGLPVHFMRTFSQILITYGKRRREGRIINIIINQACESTPSEAADAGDLLRRGAHAVAANGVVEHVVDDRLVKPCVKVVVGRQLACGARPATVEEAGRR